MGDAIHISRSVFTQQIESIFQLVSTIDEINFVLLGIEIRMKT